MKKKKNISINRRRTGISKDAAIKGSKEQNGCRDRFRVANKGVRRGLRARAKGCALRSAGQGLRARGYGAALTVGWPHGRGAEG